MVTTKFADFNYGILVALIINEDKSCLIVAWYQYIYSKDAGREGR